MPTRPSIDDVVDPVLSIGRQMTDIQHREARSGPEKRERAEVDDQGHDEVAASIRQRLDNHIAPDAFVLLASEQ